MRWKKDKRRSKAQKHGRRVAILTPCGETVATDYAMSLASMVQQTTARPPPNLESIAIHSLRSSLLSHSRNRLVQIAFDHGATHVLWIDSDQKFPSETLRHLVQTDLPILAANIMQRQPPYGMTARDENGQQVLTREEDTGVAEVFTIGCGLMWVDLEVYRKIGKPYFNTQYLEAEDVMRGEDVWFCRRAREAGFKVHIDHDLSKTIGHVGSFAFMPGHAAQAASEDSDG